MPRNSKLSLKSAEVTNYSSELACDSLSLEWWWSPFLIKGTDINDIYILYSNLHINHINYIESIIDKNHRAAPIGKYSLTKNLIGGSDFSSDDGTAKYFWTL